MANTTNISFLKPDGGLDTEILAREINGIRNEQGSLRDDQTTMKSRLMPKGFRGFVILAMILAAIASLISFVGTLTVRNVQTRVAKFEHDMYDNNGIVGTIAADCNNNAGAVADLQQRLGKVESSFTDLDGRFKKEITDKTSAIARLRARLHQAEKSIVALQPSETGEAHASAHHLEGSHDSNGNLVLRSSGGGTGRGSLAAP